MQGGGAKPLISQSIQREAAAGLVHVCSAVCRPGPTPKASLAGCCRGGGLVGEVELVAIQHDAAGRLQLLQHCGQGKAGGAGRGGLRQKMGCAGQCGDASAAASCFVPLLADTIPSSLHQCTINSR